MNESCFQIRSVFSDVSDTMDFHLTDAYLEEMISEGLEVDEDNQEIVHRAVQDLRADVSFISNIFIQSVVS